MPHITLYTPCTESLPSSIVYVDVNGMSAYAVVDRLRERRIVATVSAAQPGRCTCRALRLPWMTKSLRTSEAADPTFQSLMGHPIAAQAPGPAM